MKREDLSKVNKLKTLDDVLESNEGLLNKDLGVNSVNLSEDKPFPVAPKFEGITKESAFSVDEYDAKSETLSYNKINVPDFQGELNKLYKENSIETRLGILEKIIYSKGYLGLKDILRTRDVVIQEIKDRNAV